MTPDLLNDPKDTAVTLSARTRDPLRRMEDAAFWLEAYRQGVESHPARMFDAIDRLDAAVQTPRLEATRAYLVSAGRVRSYREERTWNAVVRLARELAFAYEACLTLFRAGAEGSSELRPLLPVVAARVMRALTLELRWSLLRYAAVDPGVWARMGEVFSFAERADCVRARLKVYPGMAGDSTVRREYLRGLILAVSGMENLLPPGQVIAERAIATVAEFFLLHRRPAPGCHFAVDLQAERAPCRLSPQLELTKSLRYFGPGDAGVLLEGLLATARSGTVPGQLNLIGAAEPQLVAETLTHLARNWGPKPPARGEERQRVLARLHVAHGVHDVLGALRSDGTDGFLDEIAEVWTVEDESTRGFGATLPALDTDWLSVGVLVAARFPWPGPWSIGVIRRLATGAEGKRTVGVQILARGAVSAQLRPSRESGGSAEPIDVVFLSSDEQPSQVSREVTLVVPRARLPEVPAYALQVGQREYRVRPRRTLEVGVDFELRRFSIGNARG